MTDVVLARALAEDGGGGGGARTYPNGTRSVDLEQTSLQCTHRRVTIVCVCVCVKNVIDFNEE